MKKLLTINNFFLLVIFCIPSYLIKVSVFGIPSNLLELLASLAIILTVFNERKNFLSYLSELQKPLIMGCVLILTGLLISILLNNNQLAGLGIFKGWFIVPMLFSFALYARLGSALSLEKVFASLYFSTALVAFIGIAYKILGILTFDGRLSAFYLSPNHLAMQLAPGFFFGLYFLQKSFLQRKTSVKTISNLFLMLLITTSIYYTYSYGAWVAILLSLFVLFFTLPLPKKYFSAFLFLFLTFTILFLSQLNTTKLSSLVNLSSRSSLSSREMIWQASIVLIKQNPIIGIGPGNFQAAYLSLQSMFPLYLEWAVPQPHNLFLAFWLQAGILGLIGFIFLLFFIFNSFWQLFKHKKNVALATPLLGFFLYTILHGLVDTAYWKNDLSFLFWICLFILIFTHSNTSIKNK